jgi:TPR repeat protein
MNSHQLKFAQEATERGDPMAEDALADYYFTGRDGEPVDIDLAIKYLTISALRGRELECMRLAKIYYYGINGTEIDLTLALLWATRTKFLFIREGYDVDEIDGEGNIDKLIGDIENSLSQANLGHGQTTSAKNDNCL